MTREVRWLVGCVVILGLVVAGQQLWIHTRPKPQALLDYPVQRVLSRVPGVDSPAVLITRDLTVQGIKCNNSPAPVRVSGVVTWMSVAPRGSQITVGRGQATRVKGCQSFDFRNPIPDAVAARVTELAAQLDTPCTTWQVTGREAPDDPMILPESWETEPFQVCIPTDPTREETP